MRFRYVYVVLFIALFTPRVAAQWLQTNGLSGTCVVSLAVSDTILFAGTNQGEVFLSTNNGTSWRPCHTGLPNSFVHDLLVSGEGLFVATNDGVFISTDNGETWSRDSVGLPTWTPVLALTVSPDGKYLFTGTSGPANDDGVCGVYRSTDEGRIWRRASSGLTVTHINCLAASASYVYAGTGGGGIFRSSDSGNTWFPALSDSTASGIVASLLVNGGMVYTGSFGGVFLSRDQGENWSLSNSGLDSLIVVDFAANNTSVFAAASKFLNGGAGVYLSTNNGKNWNQVNSGLANKDVGCLATLGGYLYAGTCGGGVWYRPLAEMTMTAADEVGRQSPHEFLLHQNYPNPFNPKTVISGQWTVDSKVLLVVYDILGWEVAVLAHGRYPAGRYSFTFDGTSFASGMYFYRLTAGDFAATKSMILLK